MKLCKDCAHFDVVIGEKKCRYHVKSKEVVDPVDGSVRTKITHNHLDPKQMRKNTAFAFMFWKNCGKYGIFWKAANYKAALKDGWV